MATVAPRWDTLAADDAATERLASALSIPPIVAKLDYNRDIQPILSNYCYHCHGPDTATRKPKGNPLRLDIRDQALAYIGDNGERTIVAGNPVLDDGEVCGVDEERVVAEFTRRARLLRDRLVAWLFLLIILYRFLEGSDRLLPSG